MANINVFLTGYYGYNNLGDDYILYSIVDQLSDLGEVNLKIEITNPEFNEKSYNEIALRYPTVHITFVKTYGKSRKFEKIRNLIASDYWIIGGGGLFVSQDINYLAILSTYAKIARIFHTKVCLYGIDIDQIESPDYKMAWQQFAKNLEFIGTRNNTTANKLEHFLSSKKILSGVDLTFSFQTFEENELTESQEFLQNIGITKDYMVWALAAPWSKNELTNHHTKERYDILVNQIGSVMEKYSDLQHIFLPFFENNDIELINDVIAKCKFNNCTVINKQLSLGEKRLLFKYATQAFTMRFHGIQFALYNATPFFAISYSPKAANILNEYGLEDLYLELGIREGMYYGKEFDINNDELIEKVKKVYSGMYNTQIEKASNKLKLIGCQQREEFTARLLE